jgi:SP family general alpha glucoside:H+ symporter-like MFS transporter
MLYPTGWNLAGKSVYVWCGTATAVFIVSYLSLPEMKDKSYRELDILFHRRISARKFSSTEIGIADE